LLKNDAPSLVDAYRAGNFSNVIEALRPQIGSSYLGSNEARLLGAAAIRSDDEALLQAVFSDVAARYSGLPLREILEFWAQEAADAEHYQAALHFARLLYRGGFRDAPLMGRLIRWSISASQAAGMHAIVNEAVGLYPQDAGILEAAARHALTSGNRTRAADLAELILLYHPVSALGLDILVDADPEKVAAPLVDRFETHGQKAGTPDHEKSLIGFALARVQERRKAFEKAWRHLNEANALQRALAHARGVLEPVSGAATHWAEQRDLQQTLETVQPADAGRLRPVFFVGTPRSGTTLIERMLATHPSGHGGGERLEIGHYAKALMASGAPADMLKANGPAWRNAYFERADAPATAGFIIDKMPANIFLLGLVRALFPEAVIVRITRDPDDTALSLFSSNFGFRHTWSTDPGECRAYIALEREVAAYWCGADVQMLDIEYESLVANPETEIGRVLSALDLPFDPACLDFHTRQAEVYTLSQVQVRDPLNDRSIGRWQRFVDAGVTA
jgi:hypothetical protein